MDYSPGVYALVITLMEGSPEYGESVGDGVKIHFDREGIPVEVGV